MNNVFTPERPVAGHAEVTQRAGLNCLALLQWAKHGRVIISTGAMTLPRELRDAVVTLLRRICKSIGRTVLLEALPMKTNVCHCRCPGAEMNSPLL